MRIFPIRTILHSVPDHHHLLRLNVGFLINQPVGYSRDFSFNSDLLTLGSDLVLEDFQGKARVSRNPQGLLVEMNMQARTALDCVRCLSIYQQTLKSDFVELYAFNGKSATDEELLLPEDGVIDFSDLVRELLILEIPINPLCQKECKGLCPECGENKNLVECQHPLPEVDPRLSVLGQLLDE